MAFNKEKVMDAARKFVDKGQIDKAVKEYLRIVHEDPKDVRVWLKIGDLYAKKGSKQDAIETYLKVARFYHEQGFFLKAVAVYKQILKLDPRLVDVILKLAELYRQLGLMSDAMQHFESVAAHFHREGNTKEALATVKKLVDLDPENIATRIKLAELYSKEGLVDDAGTEFQVACEQLRRQGRQDDFLKVAERLLWHKPENHALNRELAGLYLRRNDPRRALQKLQACFKADPRDVETLGLLAQAFQALDQKAKTVSVLKELARVHVENKQRDNAAEVYRKILEFVPNDADALQFLGGGQPQQGAPPAPPPVARAAAAPPPPQPPRTSTPMPAPIRAATGNANFNITGDLPALDGPVGNGPGQVGRMTGSMPLVDDQSLSGVDFALPEYDDADFSADMEPAPDPRAMSAAGERHAEEIAKILAETDVYVKYGLHQKAVDHLRRVFALDPDNVEAHDRLKDIFISQGREQEAEVELLKLAELVAPGDPDRAEAYLQELLAMNGTHTGAFELARRFRLRVARMSSVSSEVEYALQTNGGVAAVDVEMDDLDLSPAPRGAVGVARGGSNASRDSDLDFDPDELIGNGIAHGSPAPSRPPGPPIRPTPQPRAADRRSQPKALETDNFELEFEPSPSQSTRQMSPEHVEALNSMNDVDGDDEPLIVDRPPHWDAPGKPMPHLTPHVQARGNLAHAINRQLDDDEGIDAAIAADLHNTATGGDDDLPFDPDDARAFDMGRPGGAPPAPKTDAVYVSGFEETASARRGQGYEGNDLSVSGSYDPYGTEAVQTPPYDPTASHPVPTSTLLGNGFDEDVAPAPAPQRSETNVEDDLDTADFYAGQGMYQEARDVLVQLLQLYPNHRLINAKLREVEALASGNGLADLDHHEHDDGMHGGHVHGHVHAHQDSTGGTDAIELDEIEEVQPDDFEELASDRGVPPKKRRPTVMLEKPVDEGDADTHYDLGLAYKEMGLHDEAIKAFEKTLRAPGREAQCRVMIGMCQREMGNASEAIHQFKQGLHAEPSDRERQSIYYEIGATYEGIGDEPEALYYFEMVTKRDPSFADAAMRVDQLRSRVGRGARPAHDNDDL